MLSDTEINLKRLLRRTEELSADPTFVNSWRFQCSMTALSNYYDELVKSRAATEVVNNLINYEERIAALNAVSEVNNNDNIIDRCNKLNQLPNSSSNIYKTYQSEDTTEKYFQDDPLAPLADNEQKIETEDFLLKYRRKANEDIRQELFGSSTVNDGVAKNCLESQREKQEEITEHMIEMARHMKECSKNAGLLVKADIEVIGKTLNQVDVNSANLDKEAKKLEKHVEKYSFCGGCSFWLCLLAPILFTFVAMILFMRVFSKE